MKTLTEFATPTLKNAHEKRQELIAAGKTPEELPAALGEVLKLEGDKLTFILAALEAVGEKTHDLKRVVVSSLAEGEKAPSSAKLIGEKYYTVEYYPPIHKPGQQKPQAELHGKGRGGRDGKKGGKRGDRKGGDRKGAGDRGPRGPQSLPKPKNG